MTTLKPARLGADLVVPEQGFGGMALSDVYGAADPDESLATLNRALDLGVRLIDTANVYGGGRNEELIARLIAERRDEVVLATKFGILSEPDADGYRARGDAPYVRESVEASLRRLGTDRIDLYYYHRVDARVPIEETVGALAELVADGTVGHIGLSEVTALELERAVAVHPIAAVQSEWSLWSRDVERHVVPTAVRLGVGFVAYSPLGRGFLTGSVTELGPDDLRRRFPRFSDGRLAANRSIAETVRRLAEHEGVTPAQLALAWLYARGAELGVEVVPIPSTRRAERVDENVAAAAVTLSAETLRELGELYATVDGERASDPLAVSVGRERVERADR
ncbi:aldo/keto reductase [Rathayibacter sp. YIM 133350]|uniref:aldo/keto reductase n=1 Tax=Rathayibacter sp. YIM 133350 TaxID=3131992 RepID=UPI00307EA718